MWPHIPVGNDGWVIAKVIRIAPELLPERRGIRFGVLLIEPKKLGSQLVERWGIFT